MLSATSVKMLELRRLVESVAQGTLGIPEFQRDFDWTEADIKSLLGTVFSGWPSGSLLVLEGENRLFALRAVECAPPIGRATVSLLDGQQRLTSLYQALYTVGDTAFAVKWDAGEDQDVEETIFSYPMRTWERLYATLEQQLQHRIVPVGVLKSATSFFEWRDELLDIVPDADRRKKLKRSITDLYTYKLSAIHEYKFPVVSLDERTKPDAIARIFEKVNKTGQRLGVFDLMVAKTFEPNWNLRDKWTDASASNPEFQLFLGDDGMPLLQAIALIEKADVRQRAVLDLSKQAVHAKWDSAVSAASRVVSFLIRRCGVPRGELLPYPNLLGPLVALFMQREPDAAEVVAEKWFWYSAFSASYDAAANTRLVAHYKAVRDGDGAGFRMPEPRIANLLQATRKTQKALWNGMVCALATRSFNQSPDVDVLAADIDVSSLYSFAQICADQESFGDMDSNVVFRSILNIILVPRRINRLAQQNSAAETIHFALNTELAPAVAAQLPSGSLDPQTSSNEFFVSRIAWLRDFLSGRGIDVREVEDDENPLARFFIQVV